MSCETVPLNKRRKRKKNKFDIIHFAYKFVEQIISKKLYAIVHKKKQIVAILFTTKTMLHKIKTNMLRPFRKLYFTSSTVEGDSFQANKVLWMYVIV